MLANVLSSSAEVALICITIIFAGVAYVIVEFRDYKEDKRRINK